MAEMSEIMDIARRHNLIVIEDAAQAIGAELSGMRAGSVGHMACFSFFPSKNLGGYGDGGMITSNDPALVERLRLLRSHGFRTKYHNEFIGGNFRLDEIQAAVLRVKLKYLDGWTERRRNNAALYRQNLKPSIRAPHELPASRHIYNQFVVRIDRRDEVMALLRAQGIGCEVYYPIPLHLQKCFLNLGHRAGDFPISEETAQHSLAVPIYAELSEEMIRFVCDTLAGL
jgi:dTDP-4-amino-4,6-dideoxygalactose transaminase